MLSLNIYTLGVNTALHVFLQSHFSNWRISHSGIWSLGFDPKYFGWSGGETSYWRLTNTKVISANFWNLAAILIIFQSTAVVLAKSLANVSQIFSSRRRLYWGYEGTILCWRRARLCDLQVRTGELFMLQLGIIRCAWKHLDPGFWPTFGGARSDFDLVKASNCYISLKRLWPSIFLKEQGVIILFVISK